MGSARDVAEQAARRSYGRLVAWLVAQFNDIALAEDAVGEALATALDRWPQNGVPDNPEGWLATVARRTILNHRARSGRFEAAVPFLKLIADERTDRVTADWPDDRLKLVFACTHPAIDSAMHTPLILQTILGFNAVEIGSAFCVAPASMGQRLVRTKRKITQAGISFSIPDETDLPARLSAVLDAIYAAFGVSWSDPTSDEARDVAEEAIWLAHLVDRLLPGRAEVLGLTALMLFSHARRRARRSPESAFVPLSEQDTSLWDTEMISEADAHLRLAASIEFIGRYQLEAAIQAAHAGRARFGHTDWEIVAGLYDRLWDLHPTIGVFLGRAMAIAELKGPETGLALLRELPAEKAKAHQPYWAALAELLCRAGEVAGSHDAYMKANALSDDPAVRQYLASRSEALIKDNS
ncbi:MAG: DUF6596 domain-containing protein [Pseudomonadota bacterium]